MSNKVRMYRLDISPDASDADRKTICTLLKATDAMVNFAYGKRSDPHSLECPNELTYLEIITANDLEDAYVRQVIADNSVFTKSSLTMIR